MTQTENKGAPLGPVLGIGNDIIEIGRFERSLKKYGPRLLTRLFSKQERDYCLKYKNPLPHFAGRFAAKEAVVKALGTGIGRKASWLDIEILNEVSGRPHVFLSQRMQEKIKDTRILVSISHCDLYATGFAIWISSH